MVAANADDYTSGRIGIFFPASGQTPADGDLTGQCVTLVKWFMAEMATVPNPFAARGDAKTVGKTLVSQGLADEVPYDQRRRGDIVCLEYGLYGHIYIQLSGGRVFEENVNWAGVASRMVAGDLVYASRIGSETEAWRAGKNPHVYRLKSYNEAGAPPMTDKSMPTSSQVGMIYPIMVGRMPTQDELNLAVGLNWYDWLQYILPNVQTLRDTITNLENERDQTLYPFQNDVATALGLPIGATAAECVAAINILKKGNVSSVIINGDTYVKK